MLFCFRVLSLISTSFSTFMPTWQASSVFFTCPIFSFVLLLVAYWAAYRCTVDKQSKRTTSWAAEWLRDPQRDRSLSWWWSLIPLRVLLAWAHRDRQQCAIVTLQPLWLMAAVSRYNYQFLKSSKPKDWRHSIKCCNFVCILVLYVNCCLTSSFHHTRLYPLLPL